ncbi:hypothetical protein E3Q17_01424 [Wallemia mellicola]|uniref:CNH domain-containing protein n=1 Tax=Wallemia mellicola TaxID=1708541 RepID=A0A4T0NY43_9BASI|nr:hypothetical protein E3Q17_01424 [Wallemia mellicola]
MAAIELKTKFRDLHGKLSVYNQELYIAHTSKIYKYHNDTLIEEHPIEKKAIESLSIIHQSRLIALLADYTLTLHPLNDITSCTRTIKNVTCIDIMNTNLDTITAEAAMNERKHRTLSSRISNQSKERKSITRMTSKLAVVTKKKLCIYTWTDGLEEEHVDVILANTPKVVKILNPYTIFLGYSQAEYAVVHFDMKSPSLYSIQEVVLPSFNAQTSYKTTFTAGLTGFLGNRSKPLMEPLDSESIAIVNGSLIIVVDQDGQIQKTISTATAIDEIMFAKPYLYVHLQPSGNDYSSVLNLYSSYTLDLVQEVSIKECKLLQAVNSTLYLDTDEGISNTQLVSWKDLVDRSTKEGKFEEALGLLESVGFTQDQSSDNNQEFQEFRLKILQLYSISLVDADEIDDAIDVFIELETNPAKVIALFPENISGRLYIPQENWSSIFGDFAKLYKGTIDNNEIINSTSMSSLRSGSDTASLKSNKVSRNSKIEALLRYLTDRRQKVKGAIHQHPSESFINVKLTDYTKEQLLELPSRSADTLNVDQLAVLAGVVDTALFKAYIETRPALVGSLCRLENYCQPEEVEQSLLDRKKFDELVSLYKSKNMHEKALDLLKGLTLDEEEGKDIDSSVSYIQQLGSEYIDLILQKSRWMFDIDKQTAIQIFIADDERVESLPKLRVAEYLNSFDIGLGLQYLRYAIKELNDQDPSLHNYFADTLLEAVLRNRKTEEFQTIYDAYLDFLRSSHQYAPKARLKAIPIDDLYRARAILVDRLGKYEDALRIYVKNLNDFDSATRYCVKVEKEDKEIFSKLLKFYLKGDKSTSPGSQSSYFKATAISPSYSTMSDEGDNMNEIISLLCNFPTKFDIQQVLQSLPGDVPLQELQRFLLRNYKATSSNQRWGSVVSNIRKSENERLAMKLVDLESRYVVIDDNRICPECKKRLGNSVISVHSPNGQVTHFGCKDNFTTKLQKIRRYDIYVD